MFYALCVAPVQAQDPPPICNDGACVVEFSPAMWSSYKNCVSYHIGEMQDCKDCCEEECPSILTACEGWCDDDYAAAECECAAMFGLPHPGCIQGVQGVEDPDSIDIEECGDGCYRSAYTGARWCNETWELPPAGVYPFCTQPPSSCILTCYNECLVAELEWIDACRAESFCDALDPDYDSTKCHLCIHDAWVMYTHCAEEFCQCMGSNLDP